MSETVDVRVAPAPPLSGNTGGLIRWICTNNPFYVLSAGLFLFGLRVSFGTQAEETWAMMSGLAGYTLLLAVTAFLLVRFANVWDDVRTVLLLVVLMFLATSVTFDEVLVLSPWRGFACYLGGLLFAVVVSEALLRGIRLALPAWFRVPYYLILALFFLYPLALSRLTGEPHSAALLWGLFGFSSAAGLVFLTLLPAIRCGPNYVRANGSPWHWPLYPWVLFGLLGLAVPARAYLLCWSMHWLGAYELDQLVFGPYFLVPFGLAIIILLLEIGIVSRNRTVIGIALAGPVGLVFLSLVGHRPDPLYRQLLGLFTEQLGGDPLYWTLLAGTAFYAYATLRRVPMAIEALTAALAALAFVGPLTLMRGEFDPLTPAPLLAAAVLQLGLGFWRRNPWRFLLGYAGVALTIPEAVLTSPILVFHMALLAMLIVGTVFDDLVGRLLRTVGAALVLFGCLAALFCAPDRFGDISPWAIGVYPLVMVALLVGYARLLRHLPSLAMAAVALVFWLSMVMVRGYIALRQAVTGLDHIALSLVLFAVAVLISLSKSGFLSQWLAARGQERDPHDGRQPELSKELGKCR